MVSFLQKIILRGLSLCFIAHPYGMCKIGNQYEIKTYIKGGNETNVLGHRANNYNFNAQMLDFC